MCVSLVRTRVVLVVLFLVALARIPAVAADTQKKPQQKYPSGLSWVMQAMAALTGGNQASSVSLGGTVTWNVNNNQGNGTISLQSSGDTRARSS